jgi:hypothetical protein
VREYERQTVVDVVCHARAPRLCCQQALHKRDVVTSTAP